MTENQLFGGLNRRFEKRSARLFRAGFQYKFIEGIGAAAWVKESWTPKGMKVRAIPVCVVQCADNAAWNAMLSTKLLRGVR